MTKAGKIDINAMKKFVNKKVGLDIAHDLNEDNPTEVKQWIPTGSRWLDSIICRGKMAGLPVGKITELAGLSSAGKSYMACQIAAQAQKLGHCVVYFDAESAIDPLFLKNSGIDINNDFLYIQAVSVEKTLETIEDLSDNSRASIEQSIKNLEVLSVEMSRLTIELSTISITLNSVLRKMDQGEGSLGLLLNDGSLYKNVDSLSYNLNKLIKAIDEDPERYLKHLRFIEVF